MSKYTINILLLLASWSIWGQATEQPAAEEAYKDRYGLRVGIDLVRPAYSLFDENKKGLEIVADYRVADRWFIAGELGYSEHTTEEDFFTFDTKGQYIKAGADYNAYKNWIGMENVIVVGLRYGFSTFDQSLTEYTVNNNPFVPDRTETNPEEFGGLNASWAELVLGLKVEVLHNVFMGFSMRGNVLISSSEPENFKNLYVPGFERVYVNDFGFSFNYTLSYLIPFYRK